MSAILWRTARSSGHDFLLRYGYAVLLTAIAGALTQLFWPLLQHHPFTLFYAAVIITAWYGGLWPSIVSLVLCSETANYYFLPPLGNLSIATSEEAITMSLFALVSLLISGTIERLRAAQRRTVQANEQLRRSNRRLRSAMTETHHRVKNNFQFISALVDIQVMSGSEIAPTCELERLGRHAHSLALIHDLLTQEAKTGDDMQHVRLRDMFDRLRSLLESVVGDRPFSMRAEDVRMPVRQGTVTAILINELVSNAAKHGEGAIEVSLTASGDVIRLEVLDDGPGFPPNFSPIKDAYTGIELVEKLSRWDLGGQTHYENAPGAGARVTITFPREYSIRQQTA